MYRVFQNSNYFSIYTYIYEYIHDVEYVFEYLKEKKLIIVNDKLFQSRDACIYIAFSKIQTIFPYIHTYINVEYVFEYLKEKKLIIVSDKNILEN